MFATRLVHRYPLWRCHYATAAHGAANFQVFNRDVKRIQKDRAASNVETSRTVDYLKDEVAARVADRLMVNKVYSLDLFLLLTFYILLSGYQT